MSIISTKGIEIYIIGFMFSLLFICLADRKRYCVESISYYGRKARNRHGRWLLFFSCISLWAIAAFRTNVGVDFNSYLLGYNNIITISDIANYYEPGYGLLNYVSKLLFADFQVLIFITSIVTGALFWHSMYRDGYSLAICLFALLSFNLYFMSFTVIRQFLAVAVITLSIPCIREKNIKKFIIIMAIAISLHYTAALFLPVYFFANQKTEKLLTWKNVLFVIAVTVFTTFFGQILEAVYGFASAYRTYASYSLSNIGTTKNILEVIIFIPIVLFVLKYRKQLVEANDNNTVYIWMLIFMLITKIAGLSIPMLSRVHYYFVFACPILLSYVPKVVKGKLKVLIVVCLIAYLMLNISNVFEYQAFDFLPYHSIFER